MKLKTKFQDEDFDLGEVVEAIIYNGGHGRIKLIAEAARGGEHTFYFESLKDLNDLFEDYEEPKEHWHINYLGEVEKLNIDENFTNAEQSLILDNHLEIGNYFETEEEAKKAVEKLKAWKRLKDKGFDFINFGYKKLCKYDVKNGVGNLQYQVPYYDELEEDLDLLFGGEE